MLQGFLVIFFINMLSSLLLIFFLFYSNYYRITAILMVETDIITSIAVSQKGLPTTLVIIYVKTFKTDAIVFIDNDIICVTSH
jgi:hypothetical protein